MHGPGTGGSPPGTLRLHSFAQSWAIFFPGTGGSCIFLVHFVKISEELIPGKAGKAGKVRKVGKIWENENQGQGPGDLPLGLGQIFHLRSVAFVDFSCRPISRPAVRPRAPITKSRWRTRGRPTTLLNGQSRSEDIPAGPSPGTGGSLGGTWPDFSTGKFEEPGDLCPGTRPDFSLEIRSAPPIFSCWPIPQQAIRSRAPNSPTTTSTCLALARKLSSPPD